jgi:hypothetical protein
MENSSAQQTASEPTLTDGLGYSTIYGHIYAEGRIRTCRPARLDLAISRAMRKLLEKDSDNEMRVVKLKNKMKRVF